MFTLSLKTAEEDVHELYKMPIVTQLTGHQKTLVDLGNLLVPILLEYMLI